MKNRDGVDILASAIAQFLQPDGYSVPDRRDAVWIMRQCKWDIESERARKTLRS